MIGETPGYIPVNKEKSKDIFLAGYSLCAGHVPRIFLSKTICPV